MKYDGPYIVLLSRLFNELSNKSYSNRLQLVDTLKKHYKGDYCSVVVETVPTQPSGSGNSLKMH
jgi:hypothetical protein